MDNIKIPGQTWEEGLEKWENNDESKEDKEENEGDKDSEGYFNFEPDADNWLN